MAGVIINTNSKVKEHCIINTRSSFDHESTLGEFGSLAPGVTVGGSVNILNFTAIGLGVNIIHNIKIGEHTIVGAGATVIFNIEPYTIVVGTPAKKIKTRSKGEKYLD